MKLFMLFGANTEDEYAEVLTCWSEYDVDGNYEGWIEEVEKKKKERHDMSNFGIFTVFVSGKRIYETLTKPIELATVDAQLEGEVMRREEATDDRGQD